MELTDQISPAPTIDAAFAHSESIARSNRVRALVAGMQRWLKPAMIATVVTGFATFGVTAIQGILLARLLGPQARGEFGTAVFYAYTLTYIGLVGTQFAVARRAGNDPEGRSQLSRSVIRLGGLTGVGTILVVALFAFTCLPVEKKYLAPLCVVCALALPLEHMRQLLLAVDQGSAKFRRFNIVTLATSMVFPLALLAMWATGMVSVVAAAVLTLAAPVVGLTLRFALADKRAKNQSALCLSRRGRPRS